MDCMLIGEKTTCGRLISTLSRGSDKKVLLRCDNCGYESSTTFANYNKVQEERGHTGLTFCRLCAVRANAKKRRGLPAWNKGIKRPELRGKNHPSWKGGRYIDNYGYVMRHVGGEKTAVGWEAYRKEHVLVVEEFIGRRLVKGEVVHHIDGDKQNNCIDNLYLTDDPGHKVAHYSIQEVGYQLYKEGILTFNRATGRYEVARDKLRELLEHPGEGNQQPSPDGNNREGSETR